MLDFKKRIVIATPLISIFLFLLLGFEFKMWHPGWVVFFLIPLMPVILGLKKIKVSLSMVILFIYVVILGIVFKKWHPGWIIFLTIPIINILFPERKKITGKRYKDYDYENE